MCVESRRCCAVKCCRESCAGPGWPELARMLGVVAVGSLPWAGLSTPRSRSGGWPCIGSRDAVAGAAVLQPVRTVVVVVMVGVALAQLLLQIKN